MRLSDITKSVSITSEDLVYITDTLTVIPTANETESFHVQADQNREKCRRIHFQLVERVEYLGIAKDIPVIGWLALSDTRKVHIEYRSASDGLVVTQKTRHFRNKTAALPNRPETAGIETAAEQDEAPITEIHETLKGVTSWYLKYFTEIEARRSHLAIMERYGEYIAKHVQA